MKASEAGHMECVKVLLDNGAQVNMQDKVCGVIIHCVYAMQHVTRVPVGNDDVCTEPTCIACYLIYATSTSKESNLG